MELSYRALLQSGGSTLAARPRFVRADGWREALLRITTDNEWCKDLQHGAAEAARPFTWERCAADTRAVYARVLGGAATARQPRAAQRPDLAPDIATLEGMDLLIERNAAELHNAEHQPTCVDAVSYGPA